MPGASTPEPKSRRIGDPASVGSLYLRGGAVFIVIAVVGAFALTYTARSAPLKDAWEDLKPALLDISAAIQRFLPAGADSRGIGAIQFGPNATIQNIWSTNEQLAMTIQRKPGDETKYYWRVVAKTMAYESSAGPLFSFTTGGAPPPRPRRALTSMRTATVPPRLTALNSFTTANRAGDRAAVVFHSLRQQLGCVIEACEGAEVWLSESLDGASVAATRQNAGRLFAALFGRRVHSLGSGAGWGALWGIVW